MEPDLQRLSDCRHYESAVKAKIGVMTDDMAVPRVVMEGDGAAERVLYSFVGHWKSSINYTPSNSRS